MDSPPRKAPTLVQALVPVGVLVGLLAASVYLFGDGSSQGPNQIALIPVSYTHLTLPTTKAWCRCLGGRAQ